MRYLLILLVLCHLCAAASAKHQFGNGDGGTLRPYPSHRYAVRMVHEKIRIEFFQAEGYTLLADYLFENEGPTRDVFMCLPVSSIGGGSNKVDLAGLSVRVSGHQIPLRRKVLNAAKAKKIGCDVLWVAKVRFERSQTQRIRVQYRSQTYGSCGDIMTYSLSGGKWKGRVAEMSLTVINVAPAAGESVSYWANNPNLGGHEVQMQKRGKNIYKHWMNWSPDGYFQID